MDRLSGLRARRALLGGLVALHLAAAPVAIVPGYLSVDEATYHWMARSAASGHGVEIPNGYRERPSAELEAASIVARDGRLVARPPQLWAHLAAPGYRLAGYRGLFWMNALAFVGVLALTASLGARLAGGAGARESRRRAGRSPDPSTVGLDAALLVALATFAWEYSVAAWPHLTALLANLAAFRLTVAALDAPSRRRAAGAAAAAGLVAGVGLGIRFDLLFVGVAVGAVLVFARPPRWAALAAFVTGATPGVVALALLNHAKFGAWSPLSMGAGAGSGTPNLERYFGLGAAAAAALAIAWAATRRPVTRWFGDRRRLAAALLAVVALAIVLAPTARRAVAREVEGLGTLVVDLRWLDPERRERAMTRGPGGGVVYIGALKKSLLQSCPWLVLAAVPVVAAATRTRRGDRRLALAAVVPALFLGFYAWSSWHGGLSLNLRYLLAILPYMAILGAVGGHRIAGAAAPGAWRAAALGGGASALLFLAGRRWMIAPAAQERLYLDLPLALAALLGLVAALRLATPIGRRLVRPAVALTAAAVVWGGCVAFLHDAPAARRQRAFNLEIGRRAAELVRPDSIFFSNALDKFFHLIEADRVRIARPSIDGFDDFEGLARFHLARGRKVYGAFGGEIWQVLAAGPLRGLEIRPLWPGPGFLLAEVAEPAKGGTPEALSPETPLAAPSETAPPEISAGEISAGDATQSTAKPAVATDPTTGRPPPEPGR